MLYLVPITYRWGFGNSYAFIKWLIATGYGLFKPMIRGPFSKRGLQEVAIKSAALACENFVLAIQAQGCATCMMEGFDARRAKEILRIPDRYVIPLMVATGYDYGAVTPIVHADLDESLNLEYEEESDREEKCKRTPRLEMNEVFFGDTFGQPLELLHPPTIQQSSTGVGEAA